MTSKKVYAHNILTDVIRPVPAHYLTHPTLGANLVEVPDGRKRGRLSEVVPVPKPPAAPADKTLVEKSADKKDD